MIVGECERRELRWEKEDDERDEEDEVLIGYLILLIGSLTYWSLLKKEGIVAGGQQCSFESLSKWDVLKRKDGMELGKMEDYIHQRPSSQRCLKYVEVTGVS